MGVIVYGRVKDSVLTLVETIRSVAPTAEVEPCDNFPDCEEKLRRFGVGGVVAVAMVTQREEFAGLFLFRERLLDIPLVLILPDDSKETIRLGHRLRPRFVGFFDGNRLDVAAVIARLLDRMEGLKQRVH